MENRMQKSAQPAKPAPRQVPRSLDNGMAADDGKGQKFEPFLNDALVGDLRSRARLLKADQKR
jgi:hypothetical protein